MTERENEFVTHYLHESLIIQFIKVDLSFFFDGSKMFFFHRDSFCENKVMPI